MKKKKLSKSIILATTQPVVIQNIYIGEIRRIILEIAKVGGVTLVHQFFMERNILMQFLTMRKFARLGSKELVVGG